MIVWNIYDEQHPIHLQSSKHSKLHSEPIMKLVWLPSSLDTTVEKGWSLLSMGMDGQVFKWEMDSKNQEPTLKYVYS